MLSATRSGDFGLAKSIFQKLLIKHDSKTFYYCTCKCKTSSFSAFVNAKYWLFVENSVKIGNRPCRWTPLFLADNWPDGSGLPWSLRLKNQGVRIQVEPQKEKPHHQGVYEPIPRCQNRDRYAGEFWGMGGVKKNDAGWFWSIFNT